jgi:hypothetical protein
MPRSESITSSKGVSNYYDFIGPEAAKQLLSTYHVDYRKYRPSYGEGLARDMAAGNWIDDGSPIRVDCQGNLFDGQHRLNAVIKSNTTQEFSFVVGLPVSAYDTTDTGLARSFADSLRRRGYKNATMRTALTKLIERWESGKGLGDTKRLTMSEVEAVHDKHVDTISRALSLSVGSVNRCNLPGALLAFSWWLLSEQDNLKAKMFMTQFVEGEHLHKGMPTYALRSRLYDIQEASAPRNEYMYLVLRAWKAFCDEEEQYRIQLPSGLITREMLDELMPR